MSFDRTIGIRARLMTTLHPLHCEVIDDSDAHYGHAGAASGAGHYMVTVVSDRFEGLTLVARHQAIYAALKDWMGPEIHALQIRAHTPTEWNQRPARIS